MLNQDALSQLRQLKDQFQADKNLRTGTVRGSRSNFGFVDTDDGTSYFLPPDQMSRVLPGDRVEFYTEEQSGSGERAVLESLLQSDNKRLAGKCVQRGSNLFLEADDPFLNRWMLIPPKRAGKARAGDWVIAKLLRHPFENGKAQAAVHEVIGADDSPWLARRYAIAKHRLAEPRADDAAVEAARSRYDAALEQPGRVDLTALPFVTIDDDSTRDMDDALYAEAADGGWRLLVAVADAAELVTIGDALDRHAASVTQTAYFPGAELPMLPPPLAHDLLSLVTGEKRLAVVCELQVDAAGAVAGQRFIEATVSCAARLNYATASAAIERGDGLPAAVVDSLRELDWLAQCRWQWRRDHQLVQDGRPDYKLVADDTGALMDIVRIDRTVAHRIVEESMLATNQAAADHLAEAGAPAVFTTHGGFRDDQVERACRLASEIDGETNWQPQALRQLDGFRELLRRARTAGEPPLAERLTRMLTRAALAPAPAPHFGLGAERYTTVTSPIRRYQDLATHRSLKALMHAEQPPAIDAVAEALQQQAAVLRRAVSESEQWLQCRFLRERANGVFSAITVDVGNYGARVLLDEFGIVGQIDRRKLDGKWRFDADTRRLVGENDAIEPGRRLTVSISAVDTDHRQVQLVPAD